MDTQRFDKLTKRLSRRTVARGGSTSLAAIASGVSIGTTAAQDTTPAAMPPGTDTIHPGAGWVKPTSLFTQSFQSGIWRPKPDKPDTYSLTLSGISADTLGFSDRPERLVGMAPTQDFLDHLGFTPANPPNAALVAESQGGGEQDVLVIELFTPIYDAIAKTLTYEAKVLADYEGTGLASLAKTQQDFSFAPSFGAGGLFIDDCGSSGTATCYTITNNQEIIVGQIDDVGCCGDPVECGLCNKDGTSWYYGMLCHRAFPDQCQYYSNGMQGWDCYAIDMAC